MSDARRGSFAVLTEGAPAYAAGTVVEMQAARFVFVTPEVRVGWRLSEHVEVNAGLGVATAPAPTPPER